MHYKRDLKAQSETARSCYDNRKATVIIGGQIRSASAWSRHQRHCRPSPSGAGGQFRYGKTASGKGSLGHTILFASLFFLASGAIVPLLAEIAYGQKFFYAAGSPLNKALLAAVAAVILVLAVIRMPQVLKCFKKRKDFALLLAVATVSVFWSPYPVLTIQKTIVLLVALTFGALFIVYMNYRRILLAVLLAGSAIAYLSLIAVLFVPEIAVMSGPHAGMWRGIMYHKNALGHVSAFLFIPSLMLLQESVLLKIVAVVCMMLSVTLIIGSGSATAAILTVQSVILYVGLRRVPRFTVVAYVFGLTLIGWVLVLLVGSHGWGLPVVLEKALRSLGKDLTLTGRTFAWSALVPILERHWMLGAGYGTLWHPARAEIQWLWDDLGWGLPNAHNGYIELALNVGAPVAVALLITWVGRVLKAWSNVERTAPSEMVFGTLIVCFFLSLNLSASVSAPGGLTTGFWEFSTFVMGSLLLSEHDGRGRRAE